MPAPFDRLIVNVVLQLAQENPRPFPIPASVLEGFEAHEFFHRGIPPLDVIDKVPLQLGKIWQGVHQRFSPLSHRLRCRGHTGLGRRRGPGT